MIAYNVLRHNPSLQRTIILLFDTMGMLTDIIHKRALKLTFRG